QVAHQSREPVTGGCTAANRVFSRQSCGGNAYRLCDPDLASRQIGWAPGPSMWGTTTAAAGASGCANPDLTRVDEVAKLRVVTVRGVGRDVNEDRRLMLVTEGAIRRRDPLELPGRGIGRIEQAAFVRLADVPDAIETVGRDPRGAGNKSPCLRAAGRFARKSSRHLETSKIGRAARRA